MACLPIRHHHWIIEKQQLNPKIHDCERFKNFCFLNILVNYSFLGGKKLAKTIQNII